MTLPAAAEGQTEATGGTEVVAALPELPGVPGADVPGAAGRWVDHVAFPPRDRYVAMASAYRDAGFETCADLCAVDYLGHPGRTLPDGVEPERFEVVVNLLSLSRKQRVRLRVQVPEPDPVVPSLIDLYPGVDAMEREAFDMIGIRFAGHPDLTRILMPEDWEGHPLRKDYGVGRVPVQFKEAPGPQ
jgi:NADH-quinone oxidoreductase subunit C